jgi:hypothetical protein
VTSSRYIVTRSDAVSVTPQQGFRRPDFEKAIRKEEADRLRLLVVVGAGGTLVAALRNRLKIALADVNRQGLDPKWGCASAAFGCACQGRRCGFREGDWGRDLRLWRMGGPG